jgi:hypothetical protein
MVGARFTPRVGPSNPEQPMIPAQNKLVQQSFAKVAPIADEAAELFYDRLFEIALRCANCFPAT